LLGQEIDTRVCKEYRGIGNSPNGVACCTAWMWCVWVGRVCVAWAFENGRRRVMAWDWVVLVRVARFVGMGIERGVAKGLRFLVIIGVCRDWSYYC
jgi:hypothetical protein